MAGQQQGLQMGIEGSNSLFDLGQSIWSTQRAGKELEAGAEGIRRQTDKYGNLQLQQQEPWYTAGSKAITDLSAQNASGAFNVTPYSPQQFNYQQSPGYQFQKQQGMNTLQGSAAARGGLLSGTTMKALQKYGIGLAAQDYNNMFDQYMQGEGLRQASYEAQNQQAQQSYNRGLGISSAGQRAADQRTATYNWMGENMINADISQANARAGTIMGISRAWSKNFDTQNQIVGSMGSNPGGGGGDGGSGGMGGIGSMFGGMGGMGGGGGGNMMGNDFSGSMGGSPSA